MQKLNKTETIFSEVEHLLQRRSNIHWANGKPRGDRIEGTRLVGG
jgi:hypothetical protein